MSFRFVEIGSAQKRMQSSFGSLGQKFQIGIKIDEGMWYGGMEWIQLAQRMVQCCIVTEFHNLNFFSTDILISYSVILHLLTNCSLCETAYYF